MVGWLRGEPVAKTVAPNALRELDRDVSDAARPAVYQHGVLRADVAAIDQRLPGRDRDQR